jgi:hypothetical protein
VFLKRRDSSHPFWNNAIFADQDYIDFSKRLDAVMSQTSDPTERRLELAMPDLVKRVDNLHDNLKSIFTGEIRPIAERVSRIESLFMDIATVAAPIRLNECLPEPGLKPVQTQTASVPAAASQVRIGSAPENQNYQMSRAVVTSLTCGENGSKGLEAGLQ